MIRVQQSPTADTRTCDYAQVSLAQLRRSSEMHIRDVREAMAFMAKLLGVAAHRHDHDKITDDGLSWFHHDFIGGFKTTGWYDRHRTINRHHLNHADGVPKDVDLIDVIEHIVDCVTAGAARSDKGTAGVYAVEIDPEILQRAVTNTAEKLKAQIIIVDDSDRPVSDCRFAQPYDPWKCHANPATCYHDCGTCVACEHMQRPAGYQAAP